MANIKVLSPEVFNKISAGEVIENPVGAIKEIVENSIDAGATRITIEVNSGGLESISVTDNGCGIRDDDIDLAFCKHATSKLSSADELSAIQTLGFRGEALASIAAVSKIRLTTRHASNEMGTLAVVEDGVVKNRQPISFNIGTKIEVRDLFYNMPARKKFLKAPRYEGMNVTKYVAKLILSNPTLDITYILDGNTVYKCKGGGLNEAIFAVYGRECVENCLGINFVKGVHRISGYIGTPEYSKSNHNYQTLSINSRVVEDVPISASISQAYKPYLMTRKFPFFVLNMDIPCDLVDVNVHPKKAEVRFAEINNVRSAFYHAAKTALEKYEERKMTYYSPLIDNLPKTPEEAERREKIKAQNAQVMEDLVERLQFDVMNAGQADDVIEIEHATETVDADIEFAKFAQELERDLSVEIIRKKMGFSTLEEEKKSKVSQGKVKVTPVEDIVAKKLPPLVNEQKDVYDDLYKRTRILGSAFKTYLILEIEDKIILVDQHAAHERILFDKYMAAKSRNMQSLMFPYVFTVREDEASFIDENIENIISAGLIVEPFGINTYRIKSVDTMLANAPMKTFVDYLLANIDEFKLDDRTLIVEKIAQKACKAAVKGGECLNEYEIKYILKEVYENNVVRCPHGRPVTVVLTRRDIEKMFKRIV